MSCQISLAWRTPFPEEIFSPCHFPQKVRGQQRRECSSQELQLPSSHLVCFLLWGFLWDMNKAASFISSPQALLYQMPGISSTTKNFRFLRKWKVIFHEEGNWAFSFVLGLFLCFFFPLLIRKGLLLLVNLCDPITGAYLSLAKMPFLFLDLTQTLSPL